MLRLTAIAIVAAFAASPVLAQEAPAHKTDWLYNARWGVMYHFSSGQRSGKLQTKEDWNKVVSGFDVKGLVAQLKDVGAGYLLITAAHYGNGLCPNKLVDDGKFPTRDLVPELSDELNKNGMRLMLYYPTFMGDAGGVAKNIEIIGELSKRYGKKVSGWWLDNNCGDETRQKAIADAARSGNPDTLIAFSPPKGNQRNSPYEDYTAGNNASAGTVNCTERFIQGLQWHTLTLLGKNWGGNDKDHGAPRQGLTPGKVAQITVQHVNGGGVITWDTSWEMNGLIRQDLLPYLKAINEAARGCKRDTPAAKGITAAGVAAAAASKTDWLFNARWGVSVLYSTGKGGNDAAAWEATVKDFDVKGLVKQLVELKAGYLMIAARQAGAPPLAPETRGDKLFPARDVIAELADELAANKIALILMMPLGNEADVKAVAELSKRYGKKVGAWWFDNRDATGEVFKSAADAARSGNPEALISISGGVPHARKSPVEDFTNGQEMNAGGLECESRIVQGLQWHTLAFLGYRRSDKWKAGGYTPDKVAEITSKIVIPGGVISWRSSLTDKGLISEGDLPCLAAAGKNATTATREVKIVAEKLPVNPVLGAPPADATAVTLVHTKARAISAKMDWFPERQESLGVLIGVGQTHMHFVRSQLLFDLSKVDKSKPLVQARLYLYFKGEAVGNPASERNQLTVARYLNEIGERDYRWYLANYAKEGMQTQYLIKPGMLEIDVTEIVKAWLGGATNGGFRTAPADLGAAWQRFSMTWHAFDSEPYNEKDHPNGPRLVIYQKK
ncbi:MAG: DNRLRE domain-containing protein [Planctomycetaceae bacterium]|nr:DNRLRE domain-containing protein [Planctomycetaceae bacterium]